MNLHMIIEIEKDRTRVKQTSKAYYVSEWRIAENDI